MKVREGTVSTGATTHIVPRTPGVQERRLALLKRSGLFGEYTHGTEITRACSQSDLRRAYRLVYELFLKAGYIGPNTYEMRLRVFEAVGETATFVAKTGDKVIGVLSLVLDSADLGLPSDVVFRSDLDSLRSEGLKLCEGTNHAVAPVYRRTAVTTNLVRCGFGQALLEGCDVILVAISPSHKKFFELLGFRAITDVRSYSSEVYDPVVMMRLDMDRFRHRQVGLTPSEAFARDFLWSSNPFLTRLPRWKRLAYRCFHEVGLLRRLFVLESDLLETRTHTERQALRHRWGERLFDAVVGIAATGPTPVTSRYVPVRTLSQRPDVRRKRPIERAAGSPPAAG